MDRELLTTTEAASQLGVTSARIRQLVLSGDIKAQKVGRDVLIPASEIEAAKNRKTKPGPAAQAAPAETPITAAELEAGDVAKLPPARTKGKKASHKAGSKPARKRASKKAGS